MVRRVEEKESYTADTAAGEGDFSVDEKGAQQDIQTERRKAMQSKNGC